MEYSAYSFQHLLVIARPGHRLENILQTLESSAQSGEPTENLH